MAATRAWTFGKPASDRVVLYIRHAESKFNLKQDSYFADHPEIDHTSSAYWSGEGVYDPLEFDAPLSDRGVQQAAELGALVKGGSGGEAGAAESTEVPSAAIL
eukprot:gene19501-16115_t